MLNGYKATLKSLDVEEPIDLYVHRPLGYVVALAAFRTPISPNHITLLSAVVGIAAGVCILLDFPYHMQTSGLLIVLSAVLDCADGQLARMRKSSSTLGRMLDGVADAVVTFSVVGSATVYLWRMYADVFWVASIAAGLALCAIATSSFHTGMYDHYKNVFLQMTQAQHSDAESYFSAKERWKAQRASLPLWKSLIWRVYLFYTKSQASYIAKHDPFTSVRVESLPPYDAERAAIYVKHNAKPMKVWRSFFGFGSLLFGLAVFVAIGRPDIYLALRLVPLNALFYCYLMRKQREASRRAFQRIRETTLNEVQSGYEHDRI